MICYNLLFIVSALITRVISANPNDVNAFNTLLEIDKLTNKIDINGVDRVTCTDDPEDDMTTIEIIRKTGYPVEEHFVKSQDGYILALHRIPGPKGSRAVLLRHGLLDSSFSWVYNGKTKGLAYALANNGYDVWMGNARGNVYSRRHSSLSPTRDSAYWNFSFHEMGKYDVPAEIEYITSLKNDSLFYIGHSMGATMFFIMSSERPETLSKIKAMFALAPAVYVDHLQGIYHQFMPFVETLQKYSDGHMSLLPIPVFKYVAKCLCDKPLFKKVCQDIILMITGDNPQKFNMSWLSTIASHAPAGTSLKTVFHYVQIYRSKEFINYDYGATKNMKIYNSLTPPKYNLSKADVPVAYFYGQRDILTAPQDVLRSWKEIPNKIELVEVENQNFTHFDFVITFSSKQTKLLNSKILSIMKKYDRKNE